MSDKVNDGGPAFPCPAGHAVLKGYQPGVGDFESTVEICKTGMTLRDYFAAAALPSAIQLWVEHAKLAPEGKRSSLEELAYEIADKMLLEREKGKQ